MIHVFMYHDVRDLENTRFKRRYRLSYFLRTREFLNQLDFISKKFTLISSLDLINKSTLNKNKKYAVITFDDGLKDQYNLLETLVKKKVSATFFIPSESVKKRILFHSHKIQFILASANNKKIVKEILSYINEREREKIFKKYSLSPWKNNIWSKEMIFVTYFLRNFNSDIKYEICNKLFEKYVTKNETELADDLYINKKETKELIKNGMVIGGHGDKSLDYRLLNYKEQFRDIKINYEFIKSVYNERDFDYFVSYPNGGYNQDTLKVLKQFNCKLAFTTKGGNTWIKQNLEIPRFDASKYEFR